MEKKQIVEKIISILEIQDEAEFKKEVVNNVDDLIKLNAVSEMFDGLAISMLFDNLSGGILSKKYGEDWFQKSQGLRNMIIYYLKNAM